MIRFHFDRVSSIGVQGWAFDDEGSPLVIEARKDGLIIGSAVPEHARWDVRKVFPTVENSIRSGFGLRFLKETSGTVAFVAKTSFGHHEFAKITIDEHLPSDQLGQIISATEGNIPGPFPRQLSSALPIELRGQDSDIEVAAVRWIMKLAERNSLDVPGLLPYLRYIRAVHAHCETVERFFPENNTSQTAGDMDISCKQNSVLEMMSIAHHLYVLKRYGVRGGFAEFGCFKGFSSAMLSYACSLLNVPIMIFDSFEGLPPSDSDVYKAGSFAGGLEEVRRHVREYGVIENVTFHKGFFSDSLKRVNVPPLCMLWMDVDLLSSATDVMTIADRVDPRGAIFSHESPEEMFDGWDIVPGAPNPGNVVLPLTQKFSSMGQPLTGRHMFGCTSAFWRKGTGLPALSPQALKELIAA